MELLPDIDAVNNATRATADADAAWEALDAAMDAVVRARTAWWEALDVARAARDVVRGEGENK